MAVPRRWDREHLKYGYHHQRLDNAGGKTLHDAPENDEVQGRAVGAQKTTGGEQYQHQEEGQPLAEHGHEPGVEKLAGRHGGDIGRRQELRLVLADPEGAHDVRHRDIDDGAGQHHRKSGCHPGDCDQPTVGGADGGAGFPLSARGCQSRPRPSCLV